MHFTHLFVPFKKALPFGNENKNKFSFCISLTYSYLCSSHTRDMAQPHKKSKIMLKYREKFETSQGQKWRTSEDARRSQTADNIKTCLITGKCILFIAVAWAVIRAAWLSYDWFPMVKSPIPELFIPFALSFLTAFILKHEIEAINDKYEKLAWGIIFSSSALTIVNAGFIAEDATTKVVSVGKLTDLSKEEIRNANYLQIEITEPDTSSYNYTTDYYIQGRSRSSIEDLTLCVYQVCPLKEMKGAFVCSESRAFNSLGVTNQIDDKMRRWMAIMEASKIGTIQSDAISAHFFKVIRKSDNIEQYMKTVSPYLIQSGVDALAEEDVILLKIDKPDSVDGYWNNVAIAFGTLIATMILLALLLRFTGGVSRAEYNKSKKSYDKRKNRYISYMSQKGNFLILLPPLLIICWGLYMIYNGYTPEGSNNMLFDKSGACTPESLTADGEWWRIFSSMFIHRDIIHVFENLVGYGLGAFVLIKNLHGRDIAFVFLISGALSIGFAVLYSHHSVIGASGGVFGLYGASLSMLIWDYISGKRKSSQPIISFCVICVLVIINIILSFRSNVSMSCHLSGMVAGAIVVWPFRLIYHLFDATYKRYLR